MEKLEKQKFTCKHFDFLHAQCLLFTTENMKKKDKI